MEINKCFQVIGAAVFIDGMVIRFTTGFFANEVVKLLNKIEYNNIEMGYFLTAHAYGTIACGGLTIFKGVFGLVAAKKQSKTGLRGVRSYLLFVLINCVLLNENANFESQTVTDIYFTTVIKLVAVRLLCSSPWLYLLIASVLYNVWSYLCLVNSCVCLFRLSDYNRIRMYVSF